MATKTDARKITLDDLIFFLEFQLAMAKVESMSEMIPHLTHLTDVHFVDYLVEELQHYCAEKILH